MTHQELQQILDANSLRDIDWVRNFCATAHYYGFPDLALQAEIEAHRAYEDMNYNHE